VSCDGQAVAEHARVWARHQTISDPWHLAAARALRRGRLEVIRPAGEPAVEIRRLAEATALHRALERGGIRGRLVLTF
jgi:hypothetical protein